MVKARAWLALVLISFGTVAATVSCGSDETPGGGVLLTGGAGGGGGSGGKAGALGRSGSGGSVATDTGVLGSSCLADKDCGGDFKCVTPDDATLPTSGGPAHGLCTIACKNGGECDAVSPGAGCVNFGDAAYCLEPCTVGDLGADPKCHDRPDAACQTFTDGETLCIPVCAQDADCGGKLFCDQNTGLCAKTKPTGDPVGTPCDPMATSNNCLGICLIVTPRGVTPQEGVCAQLCPLGQLCMYDGTKAGGLCTGALTADAGLQDLGFCEPGCACSGDCSITGDLCRAWTASDSAVHTAIGSAGVCFPDATGSMELTCGEGGAGGVGSAPPPGDTAGASGAIN